MIMQYSAAEPARHLSLEKFKEIKAVLTQYADLLVHLLTPEVLNNDKDHQATEREDNNALKEILATRPNVDNLLPAEMLSRNSSTPIHSLHTVDEMKNDPSARKPHEQDIEGNILASIDLLLETYASGDCNATYFRTKIKDMIDNVSPEQPVRTQIKAKLAEECKKLVEDAEKEKDKQDSLNPSDGQQR